MVTVPRFHHYYVTRINDSLSSYTLEKLPAGGLRLFLHFLLVIGITRKENAEEASIWDRPSHQHNELIYPRDCRQANEPIVVMDEVEKHVDLREERRKRLTIEFMVPSLGSLLLISERKDCRMSSVS